MVIILYVVCMITLFETPEKNVTPFSFSWDVDLINETFFPKPLVEMLVTSAVFWKSKLMTECEE